MAKDYKGHDYDCIGGYNGDGSCDCSEADERRTVCPRQRRRDFLANAPMETEEPPRCVDGTTIDGVGLCVQCIAGAADLLDADADRATLVGWLAANDRNGCYTDADMAVEGWAPMTLADAWRQVAICYELCDPDHDPTPLR